MPICARDFGFQTLLAESSIEQASERIKDGQLVEGLRASLLFASLFHLSSQAIPNLLKEMLLVESVYIKD